MSCSVTDCPNPTHARGWCKKHWQRWRTTGDPLMVKVSGPTPQPAAERFWRMVEKTETCWLWTGAKASKYGHGKFMLTGPSRNLKAHRWAYEALVGSIPPGMTLDHLCRVPACVNPAHLEPVTLSENVRRQCAAKTHCPQGHPLSGENLYLSPAGTRACRTCRTEASRRLRARRTRSTGDPTRQR